MKLVRIPGFLLLLASIAARATPPLPLHIVSVIPLPGSASRFDYQSFYAPLGRLFISHMGDGHLVVFDTAQDRVRADLSGFPGATGVTAVPALGRVYVSVTGSDEIAVVDARTLVTLARIPAGDFPDGSSYVPSVKRLFVSDESGGTLTVINTVTDKRIAAIPLGGAAGMNAYDSVSGRLWVNEQTHGELLAVDPQTDRLVKQVHLPDSCVHNHGLLLDAPARLAFIACDHNARLLLFDLRTLAVLATYRVGREPDVLAFDAPRGLLYVASESGVVTVFRLTDGRLRKLGEGFLGDDAHTVSADPATGNAYFPIENWHGHPALIVTAP